MILCREQFLPSENKVFALPGREEKTRWGWEMTPTSPTAEVAPRRDGETSRTRQKIKELRESGQHWQVSDLGQSWPWNSSVFLPINYGSDFQVEKKNGSNAKIHLLLSAPPTRVAPSSVSLQPGCMKKTLMDQTSPPSFPAHSPRMQTTKWNRKPNPRQQT